MSAAPADIFMISPNSHSSTGEDMAAATVVGILNTAISKPKNSSSIGGGSSQDRSDLLRGGGWIADQ